MSDFKPIDIKIELIGKQVVDAAIVVHKEMGPGLLESVYEECLEYELSKRGLKVERQLEVPLVYQGKNLDSKLRLDLLIKNEVIVELKSVDQILDIHKAQVLTYLKLMNKRLAFLINFNVPLLKNGLKRFVL